MELLFFLVGLVPLISHLLLPIRFLLNFVDTVFDHGESLSDFEVFHVLLVIEFISKF